MVHLYDFRVHRRLEFRVYGRVEVGTASTTPAMVPEKAVGDSSGSPVTELKVKNIAASGGCHHSTACEGKKK